MIEKVNLSTSNTITHIIFSAEGLKNPMHMMIDTRAGSNLIKQRAVKTNVNIFGYLTTLNIIPNEVPIEHDGILGAEFF